MLIRILCLVAAVIVTLALTIATRPSAFRIARSITVAAPPAIIFANLDDFHRWSAWSPYDKLDPGARKSYLGPASGPGASYHYVGRKLGEGRMTVTRVQSNEVVDIRAEFIKPFAATNDIEFSLKPTQNGITVTWAMTGNNTFIFKALGLFVNVDRMVGREFESGLAALKRVSEQDAARAVATAVATID